jgi:hypothetical protein
MDTHHDTSFKSILENDFIPSTSRARICSYLGKGVGLWLVDKSSICLFSITHSIFTLALYFCLSLIQPSASNPLTCKCGHKLHASNMHLAPCPFKDQQITTHNTIQYVIKKVDMLYGERSGTPLHQEFHYKSIYTCPEKTKSLLPMW